MESVLAVVCYNFSSSLWELQFFSVRFTLQFWSALFSRFNSGQCSNRFVSSVQCLSVQLSSELILLSGSCSCNAWIDSGNAWGSWSGTRGASWPARPVTSDTEVNSGGTPALARPRDEAASSTVTFSISAQKIYLQWPPVLNSVSGEKKELTHKLQKQQKLSICRSCSSSKSCKFWISMLTYIYCKFWRHKSRTPSVP